MGMVLRNHGLCSYKTDEEGKDEQEDMEEFDTFYSNAAILASLITTLEFKLPKEAKKFPIPQ